MLLEKGADVHAKANSDCTPLHLVVYSGYTEVAKVLLANGADVHARTQANSTPLHYAVEYGHTELVKLLLENGADVNVGEGIFNKVPLFYAVYNGHTEVSKLLLEKGPMFMPNHIWAVRPCTLLPITAKLNWQAAVIKRLRYKCRR